MEDTSKFDSDFNSLDGNSGGSDASTGSGADIFQKINALLDKKIDFGGMLNVDAKSKSGSSVSSLSPTSNSFYPSNGAIGAYNPFLTGGNNGPPGLESGSQSLSSLLGLPPIENTTSNKVKTLQYGDLKYPDVTSPLNKILSQNRYRSSLEKDSVTSSFGLKGFGSLGSPDSSLNGHKKYGPNGSTSSPNDVFEEGVNASNCPTANGHGSKFDFMQSDSPGSDDGYGTSYGSGHSASKKSADEKEIGEILRNLNLNGSPSQKFRQYPYQPPTWHVNDGLYDPSISQSVVNLQALQQQQSTASVLQNLHDLNHYMNSGSNSFHGNYQPFTSSLAPPPFGNQYDQFRGHGGNAITPLDRAAKIHRNGTAIHDASCTWSGQLPPRNMRNVTLSCKVFLGGVPWDITESGLCIAFEPFGNVRIEWPGKDNTSIPKGYLYVIFENDKQVEALLNACTLDHGNGGSWYFRISSRRMRNKEVQVIPWVISDSNFVRNPSQRLDPQKTVFVGALHGMLTAEGLSIIFNDLFGGVLYAGVDTDKFKYPMGSGRVTFNNHRSYLKAVSAAFIEIKTAKFSKKVQVDPYLEDALCSSCGLRQGPYFCREVVCFKYFCRSCWETRHTNDEVKGHKPLMRNSKNNPSTTRNASIFSSLPHQGAACTSLE